MLIEKKKEILKNMLEKYNIRRPKTDSESWLLELGGRLQICGGHIYEKYRHH